LREGMADKAGCAGDEDFLHVLCLNSLTTADRLRDDSRYEGRER
jgi:hypothetical protein